MIRQAISCDICGTEMQHPNHWFVAHQLGSELRISGWNSRKRLRAGAKHLCGQKCLHQLADEFMAETLRERVAGSANTAAPGHPSRKAPVTDASRTSVSAHAFPQRPVIASGFEEIDSSARVITPPAPLMRNSRAEAWQRERERQQRAADHPRRSIA